MTNTTVDSKKKLLQLKKLGSLLDHNENLYSKWDNQYEAIHSLIYKEVYTGNEKLSIMVLL